MGPPSNVRAFVRRLENQIASVVAGRDRVALAYSGGLASTLVAMVARKRCDVACVVAGVEGSPDVRAAKIAKDYLDYRMEYVILDRAATRRIRGQVGTLGLRLTPRQLDSLVPLQAALERVHGQRVMSGFGSPRLGKEIAAALRQAAVTSPLHTLARGNRLPRTTLRAAALALGLPSDWAAIPHRAPAGGAGIDRFLQEKQRKSR